MAEQKYYWLKLKRDFFRRNEIEVVKAMPSGTEYVLFYLELLLLSLENNGELRITETIPYSDSMLASVTHTDIEIVRGAVTTFTKLGMMEMLDDGTLFMKEVESMTGSETVWAERKRIYRNSLKQIGQSEDNVLQVSDTKSDKSKEYKSLRVKELESNRDKENKSKEIKKENKDSVRFTPPTLEEVDQYIFENGYAVDAEQFISYYESQKWKKANGQPLSDWQAAVRYWERSRKEKKPQNRAAKELQGFYDMADEWSAERSGE